VKNYKKRKIIQDELVSITCDCCKKIFKITNDIEFEFEEFLCLEKIAGFASIFGDGSHIELDLCQHCTKKLLGPYLRIKEQE